MKLKAYQKVIWKIELGAICLVGLKFTQYTLSVSCVALLVVRLMKDCFQANPLQGSKLS